VDNGKQVAILVTTILAYQHYRTFGAIKDMPVTIGYLNRFRTAKQKSRNYKDLAEED
jgi:transcription-repair coupling factor (superfamily II helicase)